MNGLKFCSLAILFLVTCFGVVHSQAPSQSLELIQAANAASDLSKIEPYRLDAEVIVNNGHGGEIRGRLTIFKDHERSRTEFAWGNYKELTLVLGNRLYVVRNAPGLPPELYGLPDVRWLWRVLLSPRDKLSQPFTVDFPDLKANCIADEAGYEINRYCFDPSTKVLIETAWAKHKERAKGGTWYLDYRQTEGQHFPGTIRRFSKGGTVTGPDIGNIQVAPAQFDPALFLVPPNAREFETCDDMQMARLAKKEEPIYPLEAKLAHLQGDVYIAAVIGEDGNLEDLRPVKGAPVLIQSVLDAVKQWRYSPAMCGTKPVAVQTELLVQFRM